MHDDASGRQSASHTVTAPCIHIGGSPIATPDGDALAAQLAK